MKKKLLFDNTAKKILNVLKEYSKDVNINTSLESLNLTSVDYMYLKALFVEYFDVYIDPNKIYTFRTVKDLVNYFVEEK